MSTAREVRKTLTLVAGMVINGELDAKDANSIIAACNAVLGAIRTDEQQKKLDELEKLVLDMQR